MDSIQTDIIKNESKDETSKLSSLSDSLSIKNESAPNSVQSNANQSNNLELSHPDDLNSANLSNQSLSNQSNQNSNSNLTPQQMNSNLNLNNSDDLLKGVDNSSDFNSSANVLIKNEFGKLSDLPEVENESSSPNSSILTSNINKLNKTNSANNVGVPNNGTMSMPCNNLNNMNMNGPIIDNSAAASTTSNIPMNNINMNCKISPANGLNNNSNNSLNSNMANNLNNNMNSGIMNNMNPMVNTMMTGMSGNMPNGMNNLPLNNSIKNSNSQPAYMQTKQVYVFTTSMANKGAEAVMRNETDSIISYHASQEQTRKFIEENALNKQHLPGWTANALKRSKQSPCSISNNPMNGQSNNQQNSMSPYGGYRPPSNSSVVSNASYRLGPSPGLQNDMNNWNTGTPNTPNDQMNNSGLSGWQSPQPNNNFINNPALRNSMNNNMMNGSGMQRNWSQADQLNDQANGPFMDENCMMSNQLAPQQQPVQQPTSRRRKNQSHVSPISQNSSALNSPSPNQRQNPPPYSPATSSVNSMRLPPYASPGPSTPSSMDGSMKNSTNSPKSMHHLNQQFSTNSLDQLNGPPLSPVTKKCKSSLDNSVVGGDCFNPMNSSLPNNSNNKQAICKLNPLSDPHLMPVPTPQKIQYLPGFEGEELTIQKQPNTSLPDSELIGSELDFMNNLDYISAGPPTHPQNQLSMQSQQSNQLQNPNLGSGGPPPMSNQVPQFMNNGPPSRMPINNSPFNNGPPHLQQPNQMIGLDNSSNNSNLVPNNNQSRFNSANSNQFDPRMPPHPSFCSPNQGPPQPMNNPNMQNRYDMYVGGPPQPNSRMPPQQQFKPNQLIGGPLITNPNDFNSPLNEPPSMGSNHLQNLQKMAHTLDDGPPKLDSGNSSLNSSQFSDANLMNSNNNNPMMIRSNSSNPMINNNDPMNCIVNSPQQSMQQQCRLPPVGNYSNPNIPQPMGNAPNQFNSMNPNNPNSIPSDPSYQQMQSMPGNYAKMQNYNQSPAMSNLSNVPGQPPVGFKQGPLPNQGHPMSGAPSPIPNQGFPPGQGPPPQRNMPMNYNGGFNQKIGGLPNPGSMQNMPPRSMNNSINVQMNNAKPSTIGYVPANRPINPTAVQQQRPPNLEFLPRYSQGPPPQQFQPNNSGLPIGNDMSQAARMNNNMPPMMQRGPSNQQMMANDSPMISNQQMYRQQNGPMNGPVSDGGMMHGPPMNGNQMPPNQFNSTNQMPQSFNPGNYPPMMNKQPQFYSNPNDTPPTNYDNNPASYNFPPRQMYANQTPN